MDKKKILHALIIIITFFLCFYNLGERSLERWDEYTNYRVVSDTIKSNDLLYLKYTSSHSGNFFEKPPLWYWLSIISFKLFGDSNVSLRLVSASASFAIISISYLYFSKKYSTINGIMIWFGFVFSRHFWVINPNNLFSSHTLRSADLDSLQLFLIFASLITFDLYFFKRNWRKKRILLIIGGLLVSLAYLAKGPFAFLPVILFILYDFLNNSKFQPEFSKKNVINYFKKYVLIFIPIVLLVGGWIIIMFIMFKDSFLHEYFFYHTISRFTNTLESHHENYLFYFKILFNPTLFIFGILIPPLILRLFKTPDKFKKDFLLFSGVTGTIISFIIIELTQTKLAWYIFYTYIFGLILVGSYSFKRLTSYS